MSLLSKFAGRCKVCGVTWDQGATIHKNPDWKTWCANANCTQGGATPKSTPYKQPAQKESSDAFFDRRQKELKAQPALIDEDTIKTIQAKTRILYNINETIAKELGKLTADPNPAMIGQFTKIIYDELAQN